jgi:predicted alpha/beta hydrolase
MKKNHVITCEDQRQIHAVQHSGHHHKDQNIKKRPFIVFNSALGIKQEFYDHFIQYLVSKGNTVITWDARGIGKSTHPNGPSIDNARMRDWGQKDLEAVLNYVVDTKLALFETITVMGHSAGGHLIGLAPSITKISKIILISSGTCTWKLYPVKELPKILFSWFILVPFAVAVFGHAPGNIGIGHDLPRGVIMDWRNWSISRDYLFSDKTLGTAYYKKITAKIDAIGFSDDHAFSPPSTMKDLIKHFPNANTSLKTFSPKELGVDKIGHFAFFKKKNHLLWGPALESVL